uniref:hypothetical protein n=1 Tax=Actinomadura sp. SCN-SB TaxID=3373092 RepID=UPI003753E643
EAARIDLTRKLSACDRKLARYRAALEAGADPAEVTTWINSVQQERARLKRDLRQGPRPQRPDHQAIASLLQRLADLARVVVDADPGDKAELYKELGLKMTYHPQKRLVEARVIPDPHMYKWFVSEGRAAQQTHMRSPPRPHGAYGPQRERHHPIRPGQSRTRVAWTEVRRMPNADLVHAPLARTS